MSKLSIGQNDVVKTSTKRRNLIFKVNPTYQRQKFVVDYVANHEGQAGIIYCSTRKQVEELHEALNSEKIKKLIENESVQLAQANFSLGQLSKIEIALPSIQEQAKIAEFLTAIDERIDHTTAQLTHTKQWKKGLLQQMFV